MSDVYEKWKKDSEKYQPPKETEQHVLFLKQMALMSPHFKNLREGKEIVTESFLNACMQMAYDRGCARIEERSLEVGYEKAWKEVADKLGFEYGEG